MNAKNIPGRVVTKDVLVAVSITDPLNIMAGFNKCSVYPLNLGVGTDCLIASSNFFPSEGHCFYITNQINGSLSPPPSNCQVSITDHRATKNVFRRPGIEATTVVPLEVQRDYYVQSMHSSRLTLILLMARWYYFMPTQ